VFSASKREPRSGTPQGGYLTSIAARYDLQFTSGFGEVRDVAFTFAVFDGFCDFVNENSKAF